MQINIKSCFIFLAFFFSILSKMFHSRKTFHKLFLFIPIHYLAKIVGDTHFCSALYFAPHAVFAHLGRTPLCWRVYDIAIAMCGNECHH